jgi:hypothetical protein
MRNFLLIALTLLPLANCATDATHDLPIDEEASSKADGSLWYKLYTCDNGGVLDVNGNERRNLQFVVRDQNVMKFFQDRGVVSLPFGATEMILSGWTGYIDWNGQFGPVLHYQPYGGKGVFNRSDFREDNELIANANYYQGGPFVRVFPTYGGIKVEAGQINNTWCGRTDTYCPGDGFPCQNYCAEQHVEYVSKADWFFQNCH